VANLRTEARAAAVLERLGGTATLAEIVGITSRRALRTAVAKGEVERLTRGVYALPTAHVMKKRAAEIRGVLSHQSAAQYWRIAMLHETDDIHVTVPRDSRPLPRKGVVLHYADVDQEKVMSPLRTVLGCALTLPFPEALAIADSACRMELLNRDELEVGAARLRGAGRRRAVRVTQHVDARAANPFESAMRALAIEAGITGFQPQLLVPGSDPAAWVDLGDPVRRIAFEADSFAFHGSPAALAKDCRRYDELIGLGWLVQRFTYDQVTSDQEWTRQMMLAACAQRKTAAGRARRSRR
jgi:hypothetical protein